jgi:hypothetical protein
MRRTRNDRRRLAEKAMHTLLRPAVGVLLGLLLGCGAASYERAPSVVGPRLAESRGRGSAHDGSPAYEVTALSSGQRAPGRLLAREAAPDEDAPHAAPPRDRDAPHAAPPRDRDAPHAAPPRDQGAPHAVAPTDASRDAARADPARFIVRSAYLRVERKDPEEGVKAATALAGRLGGWAQHTENRSAVIMVPAEKLDVALEELGRLGKVAKKDVRGEDVTEEYLDLRIRLDNLERARLRYLELLNKAQNVSETLAVEKELERVTVDIERLKGRLNYLGRVVRYSTIQVLFERPTNPGPVGWVFYILYHGVRWLFVWD